MRTWIKRFIAVLGLCALGGLIAYAYAPKPLPVEAESVARGSLRIEVEADGKTRVRHRFVVSAPITGVLGRPELTAGDPVKEGATLLRMAPIAPPLLDVRTRAQAEAQIKGAVAAEAQAVSRLDLTRHALALAKTDFERQEALVNGGALSRAAMDAIDLRRRAAEQDVESARLGVTIARSQRKAAEAAILSGAGQAPGLADVELQAPVAGAVLRVTQESGGVVAAGTPLLEIGDPRDLEIVIDLLSTDAVKVRVGAVTTIERWGGEQRLSARIRRVEPSGFTKLSALGIEEQRVNVIADFDGPIEARLPLGDGYRVEARVVLADLADALLVPLSALFRDGAEWSVYVVNAGNARLTHVTLGQRNQRHAEVLRGLAEGDRVIVHPADRLKDGVEVTPKPTPSAREAPKVAGF